MLISNCAVIHLCGNIRFESKEQITQVIKTLRKKKPTVIFINSNGGERKLSYKLRDAIKKNGRVYGIVIGSCHSMAIAILQACSKRAMIPHSTMFFHSMGQTRRLEFLNLKIDKKYKKKAIKLQLGYEKYIAKRAKMDLKDVRRLCKKEVEIDAKNALELGLVDDVFNFKLDF